MRSEKACTENLRIQIPMNCVKYERCSTLMGKKGLKKQSHKIFRDLTMIRRKAMCIDQKERPHIDLKESLCMNWQESQCIYEKKEYVWTRMKGNESTCRKDNTWIRTMNELVGKAIHGLERLMY
jgi:hypothetical protein